MKFVWFVPFVLSVLVGIAIAQTLPPLTAEPLVQPASAAPPDGGSQIDLDGLVKEVVRLRAAKERGDGAEWRMAIAALIAFVLKWVVSGLKKIKTEDLTDRARHAIPWVIVVLGVVVAVAAHYGMGESWTNAVILGGGPPGAVLFHNLWEACLGLLKKKTPPVVALLPVIILMSLGISGCCVQLREAVQRHEQADQNSAQVVKGAVARLRQADCDAACREAALKVIEMQANAVPSVQP